MRTVSFALIATLFALGCQGTGGGGVGDPGRIGPAIPALSVPVAEDGVDSIWTYLQGRYDVDRDGSIQPHEYTRTGADFESIDRNGDGLVTEADFDSSGRGPGRERGSRGGGMSDSVTRRMTARYFQHDADHTLVTRDEIEIAFARFDADSNGLLERAEFNSEASACKVSVPGDESRMVRQFMDDKDPWETLALVIDEDKNDEITHTELLSFFDRTSNEGEWRIQGPGGGGPNGGSDGGARVPQSGPSIGTVAPDFTLSSPAGDDVFQLSTFRGKKPVALIFGSYT